LADLFGQPLTREALRPLVGDLRQLAGVRRVVLDDGPERGVRALAFSTGGGLDFWVLTDRSLDIGPLWWRGTPLAWAGANGFRSPALHDAESETGRSFDRSLSGLLVTCGLDHIRQPTGGHPLHGRLPLTPARLLSHGEDWERGEPVLFCEGEVTQARYGGEALRLHRRVEALVGGNVLRITDRVENLGAEPQAQASLYHFNLGFPMIAPGSEVWLGADRVLGPLELPQAGGSPSVSCRRVVREGSHPVCTVRTPPPAGPGSLALSFDAGTLPFLQLWLDPRPHAHILGVEPCTSDRNPDGTSGPEPVLAPGEVRTYTLVLSVGGASSG
jgi:Domain of unknown function (DUF4432)